ncbi:hypothetical protein P280DRAFT_468874 [Massarina eburnea CBS 473.64]|uniref:RNI-like protein n=1 Tax=Massarina eburnea CBS 473.64 TaxID=1395130 RepID=A0A6A6S0W1_9PLEO|nr:hypothetical protein P280DRAFT_468874 [Massarina eburnea CBS 473.64]
MHRALLLPEVVATILQSEASADGFLFTSLFINRVFFGEAARILWEGCGARFYAHWVGHKTPQIQHLAQIVQQDVQRAQIYANFLRVLNFEYEEDFTPEAKWHPQLTQLQYPQLKDVAFYEAGDEALPFNTGANIVHYSQPNVSSFLVRSSSEISKELLEALSERCPRITHFELKTEGRSSITPAELHRFLQRFHSLESLDIECLEWSAESFEEVSQYPRLGLLYCPSIEDEWLKQLASGFSNLDSLKTNLTDDALESLHRLVPNTKHLRIGPAMNSHHVLASASKFKQLRDLNLEASSEIKWSISGSELVLLAQSCPDLTEISIAPEEGGKRPAAVGLTDETIDTAAQHLANLEVLDLHYDSTTALTFSSLQSLAKHCPKLQRLELTCKIDWDYIENSNLGPIFPHLWSLEITCHQDQQRIGNLDEEQEDGGDEEKWKPLAEKIANLAPKMSNFVIKGGMGNEEELESAVTDIVLYRD